MSEEELRQVIETNFKLMALSMRDASARSGKMEAGLEDVKSDLEEVKNGLEEVRQMAAANEQSFLDVANRLDETLQALKALAFGSAETRQQISALKEETRSILERLEKLEKAS